MAPLDLPSPAELVTSRSFSVPGLIRVTEYTFRVPLDYNCPDAGSITLFGRSASRIQPSILKDLEGDPDAKKPWLVFLEGGPGFGHRLPQDSPLVRENLHEPYRILFLDYRGTGSSTPVSAATIPGDGPKEKATYLSCMRQDSIVRDLEAVRLQLTQDAPEPLKRWSLFGQSFGGFVSLTYLSFFPHALREVFLTGGLAPVGMKPEEVYDATFAKVRERNEAFYAKFPDAVGLVHEIVHYIQKQPRGKLTLPAGGFLTAERLLTLGINFGMHGGIDTVWSTLTKAKLDLDQFGRLTRSTLSALEQDTPFDTNIIYAILHEAIYCDGLGICSGWAARASASRTEHFGWVQDGVPEISANDIGNIEPLYFSGEMIFPFHFDTYPELMELRTVANVLARYDGWSKLYDQAQLARNEVPVFAASFVDDMYVDFDLARRTAKLVKGTKVFETNSMFHNAVRARTPEVIRELLKLRDDTID